MLKALLLSCAVAAIAQPVASQQIEDIVSAELLAGWQTPEGTQMAGLRLTLAPGWKTYWRVPGDAGIPPQFDFRASENLAAFQVHWPAPEVFDQSGYRSIGYADTVVLPLELRPEQGGEAITLQGTMEIGVCADICVPVTLSVAAEIAASAGTRRPEIVAALLDRPMRADEARITSVSCGIEPVAGGLQVTATIDMPAQGSSEFAVFEHPDPGVWVSEARTSRSGNQLTAVTRLEASRGSGVSVDRSTLVITIISNGSAVEIIGCPAK